MSYMPDLKENEVPDAGFFYTVSLF